MYKFYYYKNYTIDYFFTYKIIIVIYSQYKQYNKKQIIK